jgi:hypothetical protein
VALHPNHMAPASVVDCPPHHDAATTMWRCLVYTVLLVAFSNPSVHSTLAMMLEETGHIGKPYVYPVVPQCPMSVLSGPLQSSLVMVPGQYVATKRSVSP